MRAIPLVAALTTMAALAAATPAQAQQPAAPKLTPKACKKSGVARGTTCATLTVPLDRSGVVPGTIDLPVQVLRATGSGPRRGPLMMLAGGPGQAGLPDRDTAALFGELARGYDLVSFDQRGTGGSALRCAALDAKATGDAAVSGGAAAQISRQFALCASQLGDPGRFYRSIDSAADIDDLRAALGAEQITIGGTSYGTWVSQVYARAYPQRVRRLYLDSVVGPTGVAGIARSEYAGARRVIRDLCAGNACRGITRSPLGDVQRLAAQLDARAIRGRAVAANGRVRSRALGGPNEPGVALGVLYAGDLNPIARAAFPAAVRSALDGDPALLLRLAAIAESEDESDPKEISGALYAATTCAESVLPWAGTDAPEQRGVALDAALAAVPARELLPWTTATVRAMPALAGCLEWPGSPFAGVPDGPLPNVPTLILNGLDDVRTPVEDAAAVAALVPRATLVRVPNQGHSVFVQECARTALAQFLGGRTVSRNACSGRRAPGASNLVPVPPRSLAAVGPRGSGPRVKAQRSIRAAGLVIRDAALAISLADDGPRAPGLRSGYVTLRVTDDGVVFGLRNYGYVPGVRISGRMTVGETWHGQLTVSGPDAARGTLTIRDGVARGSLGGVRVALPLQG